MTARTFAWLALAASFAAGAQPRTNAVFVLGEDVASHAPFFAPAVDYHRAHLRDGDLLVTSARSLEEVREWLARSPLRGGQPWGEVTLVAHGSPWVGLAVPLFRRGEPATASELDAEITSGSFPPLDDAVVDGETELRLDSCGVGRRDDLLRLYGELLGGGEGAVPRVAATPEWIEYGSAPSGDDAKATWRRERPFVAELVARPELAPKAEAALRDKMSTLLPVVADEAPPRWTLAPVRVEVAISDHALCARAPAVRLARQPGMQRVLDDYALNARELAWRFERDDESCVLIGEASLATLGVGELPVSALPLARGAP